MGRVYTAEQKRRKREYQRQWERKRSGRVQSIAAELPARMTIEEAASIMGIHKRTAEKDEWNALQKFAGRMELALSDVWDSYKESGCVN